MSTKRGENTRKRAQKYQNTRAFKNDLHDKTPKIKFINSIHVSNVCERCKSILDWKIKYKKFKPLKFPATCTKCSEKCVKHAYHTMCKPCANKLGVCPKCGKAGELVEPIPTAEEQLKLDLEMQAMLKSLPERKRRTFLRYLENSKKKNRKTSEDEGNGGKAKADDGENVPKEDANDEQGESKKTTQDLMAFLQRLKLSCKDKDDMDDFDDFEDSDDDSFEDDGADEDSDEGEEQGDSDEDEDEDEDVVKKK